MYKGPNLADVCEEVADAGLNETGSCRFVGIYNREEEEAVGLIVELVHAFIEAFPWIFSVGDALVVAEFAHRVHGRNF